MTEERLITSSPIAQDHEPDTNKALRPERLKDFIGQDHLKKNLLTFIQAAQKRQEPLDHVLLYGPPGLGKTTLAQIIARELGVNIRTTAGPIIAKAGDLAALLTNLQANDVLFIDEIHRLSPAVEEILYPAMEDGVLDIMIGEGPAARSIQITLPPFTLIGATTRSGLLTQPLRERFGIPLAMEYYTPQELQTIIQVNATKLEMPLADEGALEIALRSRGTPRVAGRLLKRVRDIATVANHVIVNKPEAHAALTQLNVDQQGLDQIDRRYLELIAKNYGGGPVGAETLAAALSEQKDALEEVIEPYLLQQGYIQRTPRGRLLTQKAYGYLGLPMPTSPQEADLFS